MIRSKSYFGLKKKINNQLSFNKFKTEIFKKFLLILKKFPEFNLDVNEKYPFLFAWAIFPLSDKERMLKLFKKLKNLKK